MEKLRLHQAQKLIEEAGKSRIAAEKFKTPKKGKINTEIFGEIMNELIEAEEFIYSSRPSHTLNDADAKLFCDKILSLRAKLDLILADFGVIEKESIEEEIKKLSEGLLILTSKNSFKKVFSKFGVDTQRIVVAGVPLEIEDMKILNPKIPEAALGGISKKIEHVKNDINRKIDGFNLNKILVIVEADKAGEVLGNRAKELYNAEIIFLENLKDLTADEFKDIINKP
ncbi:MAG: DUF2100 domain-containing protein [Methanobacterium sp.]|uniref:DUF2100 domain-containing protein n=1 Tax=Methanobacterium sp. TaxID=2164 RepID=UPI003D65AEF9|nr:DUF2100 domain-containing protein [Methanobacterium sp.]